MLRFQTMFAGRGRFSSTIDSSILNVGGLNPYGTSNWNHMMEKQCIYVDRTQDILKLDATTFHSCLWSPRRTGKTLLCNQLALWHDKAISKDEVCFVFVDHFFEYSFFLAQQTVQRHFYWRRKESKS